MNLQPFNKELIISVLNNLNGTELNIKQTTSWMLHFEPRAKQVLRVFVDMFRDPKYEKKLLLLFLVNEMIVESLGEFPNMITEIGNSLKYFCIHSV